MEFTIKNNSSRILLERTDNGVILYDLGEDDTVISKMVYGIYHRNGIIDFESMGAFLSDILENLKFPAEEPETNRAIEFFVVKIDDTKPTLGEENLDDEHPDDEHPDDDV